MLSDWLIPPHVKFIGRRSPGADQRSLYMRFLRSAVNWTIPANLQLLLVSAGYRATGLDVSENAELRNVHSGERCFVIGNGPSLKDMDLSPLSGEVTIAANSFYKHRDASGVGLKYLCIGDRSFMIDEPRAVDWHRQIERELSEAVFLFHPDARNLIDRHGLYRSRRIHYFRRGVVVNYPELVHFDLTLPINVGNTTGTQLAIPLAIHLGCREIYLLGFDANWLEGFTKSYHFYDRHEHFPEFDSLNADDRFERYEDHLIFALRDFEAHRLIAERSRQLGISITNATRGGLLDMYPRVRFEDLFA